MKRRLVRVAFTPLCSHRQSTSGVFSMASHWALQYLPDVVTHEQIGCAHFSVFVESICFLLASDHEGMIQGFDINPRGNILLYRKEHIARLVAYAEVAIGRDFLASESEIYLENAASS